ncbi:MAG: DUF885 domain-containing protein [Dehalococcoidia bacterium]
MTPISELANTFVERLAALDPVSATGMGIAGHDHRLTDYSPDGEAAVSALYRETLAALAALRPQDERDRIAKEAIHERLQLRLDRVAAGDHLRELSIIRSPLRGIRGTFDLMPKATEDDWAAISTRLAEVQASVASFQRTLEEGARRGLTAARRQVQANIDQSEAWAGLQEPGFFQGLVAGFDAAAVDAPALRADIERGAAAAGEAYAGAARFLRETYFDQATDADGVGPERYQRESRNFNGIALDIEDTYRWGWDELHRIEGEMQATAAKILDGATVPETIAFLERDPARAIGGVDAFQRWMQDLQDRTIAEMDGKHFEIPEPLRRIEALIAPPGGALAMYYTGPSEDFSRPGRTWYPTGGKTRFPLWGEVSIAYHEGVPGHHLQVGMTRYLADKLTRFQALGLSSTSGYGEGWALYAERLMGELGYLEVPDYYLGMLRAQALRAVRVIVDIGMHLGLRIPADDRFHPGEVWDAALGDAFAKERSCFPEEFMRSEVTRYLGTPGQAISYKVGERCWLEAREAAKRAAGEAFDLKAWHQRALELGPMGLAQMQRELGGL